VKDEGGNTVKVFATKNVLTEGMREMEVDDAIVASVTANDQIPSRRSILAADVSSGKEVWLDGENQEWHRTREGATRRANIVRDARVASLRHQIEKLEAKQF